MEGPEGGVAVKWSTVFASLGLLVVLLGVALILAPYALPTCGGGGPFGCTSGFGSGGFGVETILVGLGFVGVGIVVAIQEVQERLTPPPPAREQP